MHRVDRAQVKAVLHEYKKECYFFEHNAESLESVKKEAQRLVEDILAQNFHYHFHKPPDPERAEILTMIENYAREAVLPPVVGRLAERLVLLERRQDAGVRCLEKVAHLMGEGDPASE